jgi:hypothetical protein
VDVSRVGLRFETRAGLGMGLTVPIELDLNDAFDTCLALKARVRWCAPALAEGLTVAGLEFLTLDLSNPEGQRFEKFLARLAQQPDSHLRAG